MPALRAPPSTLADRLDAIHAEIDELINARVEEIKLTCQSVPREAIRNTIVRGNCLCTVFRRADAETRRQDEARAIAERLAQLAPEKVAAEKAS